MSDLVELPADYYLNNFNKLTSHAREWYLDLLDQEEVVWLESFDRLTRDARCLLVRLLSRKGQWFRSDKLNYTEIANIPAALDALHKDGFINLSPVMTEKELASHLLTKAEVTDLFRLPNRTMRKEEMLNQLSDECYCRYEQLSFTPIELLHPQVIDLLLALFFANTRQDLTQFVLDDLGLHQFERYSLSKERRFFTGRQQLDQLLALSDIHKCYLESDRKDKARLVELLSSLSKPVAHAYIERKRQHLINDIARDLERLEQFDNALNWFKQTSLSPSRERQARIFDKLDDVEKMSDIVTNILTTPQDVAELEVGQKLEQRLLRKRGLRVQRQSKPDVIEHHLQLDLTTQRVELAVKSHYEQLGFEVFYAENTVLTGLFGLAFWQVLFSPIEGAFINQYQDRPLDLYHADFVTKRQAQIKEVLAEIELSGLNHLIEIYHQKQGISNPFVHWSIFSLSLLEKCIESIPRTMIVALFKVLLSDLKIYRNGMPDLIIFKDGCFEWVEVKGPGDKLQDNQWRWFKQFNALGVPFSVTYVSQPN